MAPVPSPRYAIMAGVAVALLGALVFLFVKTEGIDFRNDAQALALLRDMKDLDTRWDVDATQLANDFQPAPAVWSDRGALMARHMQELERMAQRAGLANEWPKLRAALTQKDAAYRKLRAAHGETLEALRALDESLQLLGQVAAGRAAGARGNRAAAVIVAIAEQLRSEMNRPDIETLVVRAGAIERRLATLRVEAAAIDPLLSEPAGVAEAAARRFLAVRAAEATAWRSFSFLTVGGRIDVVSRSLAKSIQDALDDKEHWRVYLFVYATALLIAIGYLGTRVAKAQKDLRDANEALERRVAERTRDLSETLQRLKESEAQLVQSEKMSSLGQMVAGVAHEINTPLAYVKNSVAAVRSCMPDLREALELAGRLLTTLQSAEPDPIELRQAFDALSSRLARLRAEHALEDLDTLTRDGLHGIEQIVELVANLRNFSRLDRSRVASFNVNEGVRSTLLIARSSLRKLEVDLDLGDVSSITCSPSQVNQVILNLVTNAAQAIEKSPGRIRIATRPSGADAIAIDIEDNGKGIPADVIPRIFDPFFTTKDPGKGTGLGLAIVHKIVTQHGGHIEVRSTMDVGTTFTVTLPIEPPQELAQAIEREATAA